MSVLREHQDSLKRMSKDGDYGASKAQEVQGLRKEVHCEQEVAVQRSGTTVMIQSRAPDRRLSYS